MSNFGTKFVLYHFENDTVIFHKPHRKLSVDLRARLDYNGDIDYNYWLNILAGRYVLWIYLG